MADDVYEGVTGQFTSSEVAALILLVAVINCSNRIAISGRTQPGPPQS